MKYIDSGETKHFTYGESIHNRGSYTSSVIVDEITVWIGIKSSKQVFSCTELVRTHRIEDYDYNISRGLKKAWLNVLDTIIYTL